MGNALDKEYKGLVPLTEVDLSKKGIKELPQQIGKLVNVVKLNLSNNELVAIPLEISARGMTCAC